MRRFKEGDCFKHSSYISMLCRVSMTDCMFIIVDGDPGNRWSETRHVCSDGNSDGSVSENNIIRDLGCCNYVGTLSEVKFTKRDIDIEKSFTGLVDKEE